jgi:predicted 3-demethylubiquinone-9 3-methyltransferase (glyoxalase superfamily)
MASIAITPCLWYSEKAEEAAAFYASIFPNSRVDSVTSLPADSPSGPAGSVKVVDFTLLGQPFMAMTAKKFADFDFNYAISFTVPCDTQQEIDKYWNALVQGGGKEQPCGWVEDRYGLQWQITPSNMRALMSGPNGKRVAEAMFKMMKLDKATLENAAK